jgi:CRISPR type I-E-associated protein CasB/Cse2
LNRQNSVKIIIGWWWQMQPHPDNEYRRDRYAVNRLRHARGILEACMQPVTMDLCRKLGAGPNDMDHVAFFAATLADLHSDDRTGRIATILGSPTEHPACSELRFRRLLEFTDIETQLTTFRRALALIKHRGNLYDLVESLLDWNDPLRGNTRRQRWLYDYYHIGNLNSKERSSRSAEPRP